MKIPWYKARGGGDVMYEAYDENNDTLELIPGRLILRHISKYDLTRAIELMLRCANSVPVPAPYTHGPDKTTVTGICPNCRKVAGEEVAELLGEYAGWKLPLLPICWYAALGQITRQHKCKVEYCGCVSSHKK